MTGMPVRPWRKTVQQTAVILNVSQRTIRRMADKEDLEWAGGQITIESIEKYQAKVRGMRKHDETPEQITQKLHDAHQRQVNRRRVFSSGIG